MRTKKTTTKLFGLGGFAVAALMGSTAIAGDVYGPFPVTVQGYEGGKTNSVSYSGQIARAEHDERAVREQSHCR